MGEQPVLPQQPGSHSLKLPGVSGTVRKSPQEMKARNSWAPSDDKDWPRSPKRLQRPGPAPPAQWVIATRCLAADVTLQAERGSWDSGESWEFLDQDQHSKRKWGGVAVAASLCLAPGPGRGQHRVPQLSSKQLPQDWGPGWSSERQMILGQCSTEGSRTVFGSS